MDYFKTKSIYTQEYDLDNGQRLKVQMRDIVEISFSAHSDARQTGGFIAALKETKHVVVCECV